MGVFVLLINVAFVLSTLWQLLYLVNWAAVHRLACRCYSAAAQVSGNCWKHSQPGTAARQSGGRCTPLHVLSPPWLTHLPVGWCDKGQLQESAEGSFASLSSWGRHCMIAAAASAMLRRLYACGCVRCLD
jgi:hypothetical protein